MTKTKGAPDPAGGVLLTISDVRRWEKEKSDLQAKMAETQNRLLDVGRKLEAAAVFAKARSSAAQVEVKVVHDPRTPLSEEFLNVIREAYPNALSPPQIRAFLRTRGYNQFDKSPNYLYALVKRNFDRGKITREGDRYRFVLPGSPQGETPSQSARGPQGVLTLSGGAVDAAPEVGGT